MKRCTKCGIEKPKAEFSLDKRRKDGLQSHCRECRRSYTPRPAPAADLPNEEWKPVSGCEGFYEVSNLGRVRNVRQARGTHPGRILSENRANRYATVIFTRDGRYWQPKIHLLVAKAFLDPVKGKPEVHHKNGLRYDNRAENLQYVTRQENVDHAVRTGLWKPHYGEACGNAKLTEQDVHRIRELAKTIHVKDIAAEYDMTTNAIRNVVTRKTWKHI